MKAVAILLLGVLVLAGCDHAATIESTTSEPALQGPPFPPGALFEGIWIDNQEWELVKPRPPGIGAPNEIRVNLYQIAPVDLENPLSPPITIPGVISLPGRDHVFHAPRGHRGTFRAVARTVPVLYPQWFVPPTFSCDIPDLGALGGRILYRMQDFPHPCGFAPQVYAVDFVGDGVCFTPLTSVERVDQAVAEGLAQLDLSVPEPPWPFAIRPMTAPGQGQAGVEAPACVEAPPAL